MNNWKDLLDIFVFNKRWDDYFLGMAEYVSRQSRDPSTKVGAVIVRPDKTVASVGFNGFPSGMDDQEAFYEDREVKYSKTIHAEMNVILHAREPLHGYAIFLYPLLPCDRCSVHIIQSGIKAVACKASIEEHPERWVESVRRSEQYYKEAGS